VIRVTGALVLVVVAVYAPPGGAQQPHQKTFSSPEAAANALFLAVQAGDDKALADLFGGNEELFAPDDESQEDLNRRRFLEKFREMHRLAFEPEGMVLYIGAENWPFPIPLTSNDGGWSFDTEAGLDEILFRLSPESGAELMPRGIGVSAQEQRDLEDYFLGLARPENRPAP